ncbi:hypothetical protein EMIHUDRAFT_470812 [Emiliania huxleyi CCMP1516]|uniref:Major facilitator superfamily (MFS) profile domain-containing protein n=2 Tax=Emiliania huxleyi TaxID=2903 RepID=A0A0D3IMR5_EMIH1|nr:hypothetical protein EMIHUDRAFT_470812 [Emiliania huxleyi CCMP1516]EOD12550.1 hypothetical protein EMIHUDRAFT_470812 [Emiliania huxleyi CCMP1516]|eukprot:XP_005764979.1 hypothetical protein EMIHUDRAFT_470812 [Emiliania huxleyi CCMP1516]
MAGDQGTCAAPSQLSHIAASQLGEARRFWADKQIRTAMLVPWAEAVTAAFTGPIYPFFMQNLGLDAGGMGKLRTVQHALNAASAPIAGCLLDARGPFLGIALPASLCAIGCAIRSMAQSTSWLVAANVFSGLSGAKTEMATAHLSRHTDPSRRTLAVLTALLPESTWGMLRFRLLISLCVFGCGFGVIVLCCSAGTLVFYSSEAGAVFHSSEAGALQPRTLRRSDVDLGAARGAEVGRCCGDADGSDAATEESSSHDPEGYPVEGRLAGASSCMSSRLRTARLALCLVALCLAAATRDTLAVVWPLYLKAHFGWAEKEYGLLLPLQQAEPPRGRRDAAAFGLVATPPLQDALGSRASLLLAGCGGACHVSALLLRAPSPNTEGLHVLLFLAGGLLGGATARAGRAHGVESGRLFALLSMTKLGGSVGGSLYCTAQFQVSLDAASGPYFLRGGAAPVVWLALPSLLALLALACVLPPAAGGERDASGCEEVSVEEESSSSIEASPRVKRHDR